MAKALAELLEEGVAGRHVLVRSDLNVPLKDGVVTDDGRVRASLPVIEKLAKAGARVIVTAHLGRPKGQVDPQYSIAPAAARLAELASVPVQVATDLVGEDAKAKSAALKDGEVLVLENVRYDARETSKDDAERGAFADELVALTGQNGAYVDDAFGAVHRKHASVYDVAKRLPAYLGDLVKKEVDVLAKTLNNPERPFVVVMGGAKVSDKLAVIDNLIGKADAILIGGGMGYTFIKAQGGKIGESLHEDDLIPEALNVMAAAKEKGVNLSLSVATVAADKFDNNANRKVVPIDQIPDGWEGMDASEESLEIWKKIILDSKTILWNGPVGVFEFENFAHGTGEIAKYVAQATQENGAYSLVGGGDSVAAVNKFGLADKVSYVSTGGGAMLEAIEGKVLPGVAALKGE